MNIILLIDPARHKHRAEAERGNKANYRYDNHRCIGTFLIIQKSHDRDDG